MAFLLCGKDRPDKDNVNQTNNNKNDIDSEKSQTTHSKTITLVMKRGERGYGFSVTGSSPACVRRVEQGSAAWQAGLRVDDAVISINGHNVSRSTADSVAKIVRQSEKQMILIVQRLTSGCEGHIKTTTLREDEKMWRAEAWRQSLLLSSADENSEYMSQATSRDLLVDLGDWSPPRLPNMYSSDILISHRDLSIDEQDRQTVIRGLLESEQHFIDAMQFGIKRYVNPLRRQLVSPTEHVTLFQNVETLISISEYHVYKLKQGSRSYSDVRGPNDMFIDIIGSIYLPKVLMMAETYERYCSGIKNSFRLLAELRDYEEFNEFLQEPPLVAGQPTISGFIQKPLEHTKDLVLHLQKILSLTPVGHPDIDNLSQVIEGLRNACNRINENNTRRSRSMISLVSRSHIGHSGSRSSDRSSSNASDSAGSRSSDKNDSRSADSSISSSGSSIASSIDSEVLDVQRRLVFCEHVQTFQLATATRHMIYSGELMHVDDDGCTEIFAVLLNDLLLLTQLQADDTLLVMDYPILLHEIVDPDWETIDTLEFTLGVESSTKSAWCEPCDVTFRAPSLEEKLTWKNILQQRIKSSKQRHEHANVNNIV